MARTIVWVFYLCKYISGTWVNRLTLYVVMQCFPVIPVVDGYYCWLYWFDAATLCKANGRLRIPLMGQYDH